MTTEELLKLQEKIESNKNKANQLQGRSEQLLQQLQTEFGCNNLDEAEATLVTLEEEISVLEKQVEKGVENLKNDYPDLFEEKDQLIFKLKVMKKDKVELIKIVIYDLKGRKIDTVEYNEIMTLQRVGEQRKLLAEQYNVGISKALAYYQSVKN